MREQQEKFKDEIYRPGEDVSHLSELSDEDKSERRREIEAIFADPERYNAEQEARYAAADVHLDKDGDDE